jgi:hypothetical protein
MDHLISSYRNARHFCRGSFGDKESNMRSIGAESGSSKKGESTPLQSSISVSWSSSWT